jgi:hypothetical protein
MIKINISETGKNSLQTPDFSEKIPKKFLPENHLKFPKNT